MPFQKFSYGFWRLQQRLIVSLVDYIIKHKWTTRNKDGRWSTTFVQRPEQILSMLQVARHVAPEKFQKNFDKYRKGWGWAVSIPINLEAKEKHKAYFKFNLDNLYLFNLVRLENTPEAREKYLKAFTVLSDATRGHDNAFIEIVEHALKGPNSEKRSKVSRTS